MYKTCYYGWQDQFYYDHRVGVYTGCCTVRVIKMTRLFYIKVSRMQSKICTVYSGWYKFAVYIFLNLFYAKLTFINIHRELSILFYIAKQVFVICMFGRSGNKYLTLIYTCNNNIVSFCVISERQISRIKEKGKKKLNLILISQSKNLI